MADWCNDTADSPENCAEQKKPNPGHVLYDSICVNTRNDKAIEMRTDD